MTGKKKHIRGGGPTPKKLHMATWLPGTVQLAEVKIELKTGVGKCALLGILDITFKSMLEIISPAVG